MARKSGLGKGFDSLMMDNTMEQKSAVELRITDIEPNADQPRKAFDQNALEELAENIKQHGLLQPIVVRPLANGNYQIVAGERRWRASRIAGNKTILAIIKELTDEETMEIALIENLQREDLNPIEEAEGYKQLMDNFNMTQDTLAKRVGKSRSSIANALRLLDLGDFKKYVENGDISAGHARTILPLNDKDKQIAVSMIKNGASVREIERFVKEIKDGKTNSADEKENKTPPDNKFGKDSYLLEVELSLKEALGRKVSVNRTAGTKGTITLEFYSDEDLGHLVSQMFNE